MSAASRPGEGFYPLAVAPEVVVRPGGEVVLFEDDGATATHRVASAARVLVGGGLPDEAVELALGGMRAPARFAREDAIDVCMKYEDGGPVVWLAP